MRLGLYCVDELQGSRGFGFSANLAPWFQDIGVELNDWSGVITPEQQANLFQPTNEKVFAVGDMVRGCDFVVTAIWGGRQTAEGFLNQLAVYY
jgi:glutamate synthase (NADPH/NADH) small chain